jgi:uncharacterized protein YgiM (DUF1202 family)
MKFFKNKNTVVLAVSAILILIAIIVAIAASAGGDKNKKETTTNPTENVSLDLGAIANKNNQANKPNSSTNVKNEPGKYKIATKEDPLGLRIKPSTDADRLLYINKGETVEVLAVWEDWGYVVYGNTGGWLSMNYLERVSS